MDVQREAVSKFTELFPNAKGSSQQVDDIAPNDGEPNELHEGEGFLDVAENSNAEDAQIELANDFISNLIVNDSIPNDKE